MYDIYSRPTRSQFHIVVTAIPGPPGRPIVFDVSRDGMTVAWEPPDEDGGLEVSGYIIERKEVRSDRWIRANKNPVTMTRYRSTGLIEGLEYEHRVTAINARGVGKPSLISKPAVATDPVGKQKFTITTFVCVQTDTEFW